ncbi:hypothetical protein [Ureaplasma ceti]|uniref:Uncharacterized protein n=1 Tax=Ureaplasma ceti TaxID=3119530 RepID=A0ABP9UCZ2_9BACT
MIKYKDYKEIYFKQRKDFYEVNPQMDEIAKDWKFIQPFKEKFKNVHILNVHYNAHWNGRFYTNYWISIGSNEPNAILGIDFIIVHYYVPRGDVSDLKSTQTFFLVECGPSLKYNTRIATAYNTSNVCSPVSALFFKRIAISSYATKRSDFNIYGCFVYPKQTIKVISKYFPNLLKEPSKHKNKAYCKVNNKYIKEMKKLWLFTDQNKEY